MPCLILLVTGMVITVCWLGGGIYLMIQNNPAGDFLVISYIIMLIATGITFTIALKKK